ncbi:bifunctional 5,10-methylenetetrahydrofolate dehydrogenase/5,10-methenyltetrahydrofolate cyclohydrolase [candidate division WOR-3 bacterium]|uniref:Bifunctional protein FolD n=1 Tax=candidate division WOR-3 bacterium TaxID=2052148 RepID=A0A937XE50_UNCW3|nr:bifunctional 5,10-methylenetetrahydrofolate dehydrogenase/5,10-methenyltetrahydrofolate cyclohydrolase [candidate division WOR-3 bacterium]
MAEPRLLDGRAAAKAVRVELARRVDALQARGVKPGLRILQVGADPASSIYVASKVKASAMIGIDARVERLPDACCFADIARVIGAWNLDSTVHGFIVQLPLPRGIDACAVLQLVGSDKDVDGLGPASLGALASGRPRFTPATPTGIIELLVRNGISIPGRRVVIVGRGDLVGRPLASMLLLRGERGDATVTVCHSRTPDLGAVCRTAQILVVAVGRAGLVTGEMVTEGVVAVDAGTNSNDCKLVGDIDFESVAAKASAITPVPGGVGPMTVAMLLANTVRAAELASGT